MRDPDKPATSIGGAENVTVVLALPEAFDNPVDPAKLKATLIDTPEQVRVLLCIPSGNDGQALAAVLQQLGIETQILVSRTSEPPSTDAYILRAPFDMSENDLIEFGFALSDIVLLKTPGSNCRIARVARSFGKYVVSLGEPLPQIPPIASITGGLDPNAAGWRAKVPSLSGRTHQTFIEVLGLGWLGSYREGGLGRSFRRIFSRGWGPVAYFAPENWRHLSPDRSAVDDSSRIVAAFDRFDRCAVYGSYVHRDAVVSLHFGSAFALLAAVVGHLNKGAYWGIFEFATLVLVVLLAFAVSRSELQERWTACRFAAEQLRIARMSLPLLVLPPVLATSDRIREESENGGFHDTSNTLKATQLNLIAVAEVKRIVRNHGLPRPSADFAPQAAAEWLQLIVQDQIAYHRQTYRKFTYAEERVRIVTASILWAVIVTAALNLFIHAEWFLLITAAVPAFGTALHATAARLGLSDLPALSNETARALSKVSTSVQSMLWHPSSEDENWNQVRRLTFMAADTMGAESLSWYGIERLRHDEFT